MIVNKSHAQLKSADMTANDISFTLTSLELAFFKLRCFVLSLPSLVGQVQSWQTMPVSEGNNWFPKWTGCMYSSIVNSEIYTQSSPEHPSMSQSSLYSEAFRNRLAQLSIALLTSRLGSLWLLVFHMFFIILHVNGAGIWQCPKTTDRPCTSKSHISVAAVQLPVIPWQARHLLNLNLHKRSIN